MPPRRPRLGVVLVAGCDMPKSDVEGAGWLPGDAPNVLVVVAVAVFPKSPPPPSAGVDNGFSENPPVVVDGAVVPKPPKLGCGVGGVAAVEPKAGVLPSPNAG